MGVTVYRWDWDKREPLVRALPLDGDPDSRLTTVNDKGLQTTGYDVREGMSGCAVRGAEMVTALPGERKTCRTSRWSLTAAGSFSIYDCERGQDVTPRGRKACAILAYLGSRPGAHVPREKIAELLWGDRAEPQAKASLRQALLEIRRATPGNPPLICSDRGHLWINDAAVDVIFDPSTNGRNDFVPFEDLDHISAEFDHWLEVERSRRSREAVAELRREAERQLETGHASLALKPVEAMWRFDPYDEDALRLALQAEYQAGHAGAIEQRFQAMANLLHEDLGVEPAPETRALHDQLLADLRNRAGSGPAPIPAHASPETPTFKGARLSKSMLLAALLSLLVLAIGLWAISRPSGASELLRIAVRPFRAMGGVVTMSWDAVPVAQRSINASNLSSFQLDGKRCFEVLGSALDRVGDYQRIR